MMIYPINMISTLSHTCYLKVYDVFITRALEPRALDFSSQILWLSWGRIPTRQCASQLVDTTAMDPNCNCHQNNVSVAQAAPRVFLLEGSAFRGC
jgi:hypothetical protein